MVRILFLNSCVKREKEFFRMNDTKPAVVIVRYVDYVFEIIWKEVYKERGCERIV